MRAIVFGGPAWLAQRTLRACERASVPASWRSELRDALAEAARSSEATWLLRAGAWMERAPRLPPPSATGRPLVALGAIASSAREQARPNPSDGTITGSAAWLVALARSGGDLQSAPSLPPIASALFEAGAAAVVGVSESLEEAIAGARDRLRVVHVAGLDVRHDKGLRVLQITTSLQQGGAERIVLSLVEGLRARGVTTGLVLVGRPGRTSFLQPVGTIDLGIIRARSGVIDMIVEVVVPRFGPDVVHAHLLDGPLLQALARRGVRCVTTVHNMRPGWPSGFADLIAEPSDPSPLALTVACANAVRRELTGPAVRTIRNAIDSTTLGAASLRDRLGIAAGDLVLLAVANPRPQKRLHLLPPIARAVADRAGRPVRLFLAGAPSYGHPDAEESMDALQREAVRAAILLHRLGSRDDVGAVYRTADVLVSTSAWEGLSLAQLEALACGVPVVASDVGGAREIPGVRTVAADAPVDEWASAILGRVGAAVSLPPAFRAPAMIARHEALYRRVAVARPGRGLVLVTNNFSTGGAQSSARRLLQALHARGVPVRAFVVEEQADYPTPGRAALVSSGVSVTAVEGDAPAAVRAILAAVDEDPPAAALFWNLIAEHKVRLADALLGVRVVDVSPGEMYFASLARHFARPAVDLPYDDPADYGALLHAVVVKYAAEAEHARAVLGAPVVVVPNGVDPGPEPSARPRGDRLELVAVARIAPQKRLDDLVDALALVGRPWRLRVVGGPEAGSEAYAGALRERARGLPIEWVGERADVRSELDRADAMVLVAEPAGCPNASLEAMAAGLPVVATDVGGAREQVVDGVTGLLVPARDPAALARAIDRIDPAMGRAARAHVVRAFSLDAMVEGYRRVCGV